MTLYGARLWPPLRRGTLRRARQRYDWYQAKTSRPWHIGYALDTPHPVHETIQPEPINLATQLGYSGA